jgi:hypothetical protein
MREMISSFIDGLDAESRRTTRRLLVQLLVALAIALVIEAPLSSALIQTGASALAFRAILLAVLLQEPLGSSSLNRCDEAVVLLGAKHLAIAAL